MVLSIRERPLVQLLVKNIEHLHKRIPARVPANKTDIIRLKLIASDSGEQLGIVAILLMSV